MPIDNSSSGTPLYLAPELIAGQVPTLRSDVYALGLILYQMIVGDLRKPLVSGWEREIPDPLLREDISRATDGDPMLRLDSAAELARRLRSLDERRCEQVRLHAIEAEARAVAEALKRSRARRPWMIAAMAALGGGLVISSVLYLQVRASRQALVREFEVASSLDRFLNEDLIDAANPAVSGRADVTVAEAARTAAGKIDDAFKSSPADVKAALHIEMQKTFFGLSDYEVALTIDKRRSARIPFSTMSRRLGRNWEVGIRFMSSRSPCRRGCWAEAGVAGVGSCG